MSLLITMSLDGDDRDLDLGSLLISEAREMKRLIGYGSAETFREELGNLDPDAVAFAWWLANKRAGTPLPGKFADLDFDLEALRARATLTDVDAAPDDAEDDTDTDVPTGSEQVSVLSGT